MQGFSSPSITTLFQELAMLMACNTPDRSSPRKIADQLSQLIIINKAREVQAFINRCPSLIPAFRRRRLVFEISNPATIAMIDFSDEGIIKHLFIS